MQEQYAMQTLREAITKISAMPVGEATSECFTRWQSHAGEALAALLGEDAPDVRQFRHIVFRIGPMENGSPAAEHLWQAGKELATQILRDALLKAERSADPAAEAGKASSLPVV